MSIHEYDYHLPPELIAQEPLERRDASRLLILDRNTGRMEHRTFIELPSLLLPGDALVFNDTRVLHARLRASWEETGGKVELLLLRPRGEDRWEAMARPAKRLKEGERLILGTGVPIQVCARLREGTIEVQLPPEVVDHLDQHGELPLPPYIRDYHGDPDRYQTVYARSDGSVAAPTAGLHFTPPLLEELCQRGVSQHYITLHVGAGTFRPVQTDRIEDHRMHSEAYFVPSDLLGELARVRAEGGRVVAVGTTSARSLESVARHPEQAGSWSETDIFIRPGHTWRLVDGLVTNFHLPRSTLLMLVSALAGRENVFKAYEEAVRERYRFYSFGDAMVIL
ncbi:MAG: tRNA preQ1(34) S-adenosylmethionine ribosyltransferase-isomerase QueA [Chloroflexota bacterium]|nr:tRNA preQ1(34) S-adenosylmethionine ribosyltransferase-isomerase QueA [Chloroflexota bacterium]